MVVVVVPSFFGKSGEQSGRLWSVDFACLLNKVAVLACLHRSSSSTETYGHSGPINLDKKIILEYNGCNSSTISIWQDTVLLAETC